MDGVNRPYTKLLEHITGGCIKGIILNAQVGECFPRVSKRRAKLLVTNREYRHCFVLLEIKVFYPSSQIDTNVDHPSYSNIHKILPFTPHGHLKFCQGNAKTQFIW